VLFEELEQLLTDTTTFPAEGVVLPDPLAADVNPAAALEVGQVARHGGLGEPEHRHQVADTQFPFGLQQQDDTEADRIRKSFNGLGEMFHCGCYKTVARCGQENRTFASYCHKAE